MSEVSGNPLQLHRLTTTNLFEPSRAKQPDVLLCAPAHHSAGSKCCTHFYRAIEVLFHYKHLLLGLDILTAPGAILQDAHGCIDIEVPSVLSS